MSQERTAVPCGLCGEPTMMLGTQRCDRCWELETRIKQDFTLAVRIVVGIREKEVEQELARRKGEL